MQQDRKSKKRPISDISEQALPKTPKLDDENPLMLAVKEGNLKKVQAQLTNGANPLAKDENGEYFILKLACKAFDVDILKALLKAAASAESKLGKPQEHLSYYRSKDWFKTVFYRLLVSRTPWEKEEVLTFLLEPSLYNGGVLPLADVLNIDSSPFLIQYLGKTPLNPVKESQIDHICLEAIKKRQYENMKVLLDRFNAFLFCKLDSLTDEEGLDFTECKKYLQEKIAEYEKAGNQIRVVISRLQLCVVYCREADVNVNNIDKDSSVLILFRKAKQELNLARKAFKEIPYSITTMHEKLSVRLNSYDVLWECYAALGGAYEDDKGTGRQANKIKSLIRILGIDVDRGSKKYFLKLKVFDRQYEPLLNEHIQALQFEKKFSENLHQTDSFSLVRQNPAIMSHIYSFIKPNLTPKKLDKPGSSVMKSKEIREKKIDKVKMRETDLKQQYKEIREASDCGVKRSKAKILLKKLCEKEHAQVSSVKKETIQLHMETAFLQELKRTPKTDLDYVLTNFDYPTYVKIVIDALKRLERAVPSTKVVEQTPAIIAEVTARYFQNSEAIDRIADCAIFHHIYRLRGEPFDSKTSSGMILSPMDYTVKQKIMEQLNFCFRFTPLSDLSDNKDKIYKQVGENIEKSFKGGYRLISDLDAEDFVDDKILGEQFSQIQKKAGERGTPPKTMLFKQPILRKEPPGGGGTTKEWISLQGPGAL